MHPSYYHRAHACILVFDCTRKQTYVNLNNWYNELQQYRPGLPVLVVANKIDGKHRARCIYVYTCKYMYVCCVLLCVSGLQCGEEDVQLRCQA